jgi:outer membrane biosynthesis protein TonB
MRVVIRSLLIGAAAALAACATHARRELVLTPETELVLTPETDPEVQEALAHAVGAGKPVKIHDVRPRRPDGLLTDGARLRTVVEAVITREGKVKVYAIRQSDHPDFTRECVRAVSQWRYRPATGADGAPIPVHYTASCSITTQ